MIEGREPALAAAPAADEGRGPGPRAMNTRGLGRIGITVLVAPVFWGCALLPQFTEPPAIEPTVATADTTRTRVPDPELWPTAAEIKETEPARTEASAPAKPRPRHSPPPAENGGATAVETSPSDTSAVVAPAVTVSPPKQAVEEIETETLASLREAKRLLAAVQLDRLDAAGQEKLRIVRGFITQSEEALQRQDIEAASGLARKARLLAVELSAY